jgi:hypothetical protein
MLMFIDTPSTLLVLIQYVQGQHALLPPFSVVDCREVRGCKLQHTLCRKIRIKAKWPNTLQRSDNTG